jgi:thiol-disulfide isomerase/thioredoxin
MMKAALSTVAFAAFVATLIVVARALEPAVARPPGAAPSIVPASASLPPLFVVRNDVDRTPIALAGPRRKPMLLHLWASWCGPCVAELPSILALGRQGTFDVIAVSVDDRWPDVVGFFGGDIPAEVAWDPRVTLEPTLGVSSLPTTFLIDTRGGVRQRLTGAQEWLDPAVAAALHGALQ